MSRFETPDARLRRLAGALVRNREKQRDIRNSAAELRQKTQARIEEQAVRREVPLERRIQVARDRPYETPPSVAARQLPGQAKEAIARNIEALRRHNLPVETLSPEQRTRLAFTTPQELDAAVQQGNIALAAQEERGATAGTLGPPGILNQLISPVVTPEANPLPGSAGRLTSALTTPVGLGVAAAFPAATATGLVGGTVLGEAGGLAERQGAPIVETPVGRIGPRSAGEFIGGALGPNETRVAVGAGAQRIGRSIEEGGGLAQLPGRLATEETGAIKLPPREPPPRGPEPTVGEQPPVEPPWEEVRDKITGALRGSKAITGAQATELSLERSRRIGNYRDLVAQNRAAGMGQQEAERTARGALGGEVEKVPGLKIEFTEPETEALFRRINDYDYGTEPFLQPRASVALGKLIDQTPLQTNEIDVLRRIYGDEFGDALDRASKGGKKGWDDLFDVIVLPKTVLSAFDLSYPFRQGIMVAPRHPKEFFGNIPGMVRSFGSEEVAQKIDDVIKNNPTRRIVTGPGGALQETSQGAINQNIGILRPIATGERSAAEEGFLSRLGLKIPGVKQSSRAFVTYGNKLRADLADYWVDHWQKTGVDLTPERLESLGNLLNRLTGRGTLGAGQAGSRLTQLMQAAWWSPQYRLSGPQAYAQLFNKDSAIRKIAAQNLAAFVGGGVGLLGLLKASGVADVDPNPYSTDFGKIRIGPFRTNFWGSQQLLARSIAQAVSGKKFDIGLGGNKPFPRGETALSYFRSGLAPEWSLIYDILKGENYIGQDVKLDPDEALDRLAPIALQDTIEAYQEGGPLAAGATAPASILGLSTSTYQTDLSNQLQAIGQYRGIDPKLENDLQGRGGFYDQVEAFQKNVLDETNVKPTTPMAIVTLARQQGKDTEFIRNALLLRPGAKTEKALRNPEWLKFVYDNREQLMEQRPDLVDPNEGAPDYIIRYINAREMQKASGQ